jgi:pimeloyl-ACP methyl ester carboxylesterase
MSRPLTPLHYPSPNPSAERILLVMLPGAGSAAEDFAVHGMVAAAQAGAMAVDAVALRPDVELYLEGNIAPALHEAVLAPHLANGATRIWLLGISLGGMGALLYARAYPGIVEGLVLVAPFLGTHGTMAEVTAAGSFGAWSAVASGATEPERRMLCWLQRHLRAAGAQPPRLFLGHGRTDRFATGHRLLAAELPPGQVALVDGGHDWPTWTEAWGEIMRRRPFG